jgi:hypothetical protein
MPSGGCVVVVFSLYANLSAEWWSTVGQLIERRQIIISQR